MSDMGFIVRNEVPFGKYVVDVYVPEMHCALEADGPQHSTKRDGARDAHLLEVHGLPILRFKNSLIERGVTREATPRPLSVLIQEFFEEHGSDIELRKLMADTAEAAHRA